VQLLLVKGDHLDPQIQQQLLHVRGVNAVALAFCHQAQLQARRGAEMDDCCSSGCVEQDLGVALLQ
jgi:hypothetical protein